MTHPSCAAIACSHGLGHARRMVSVLARWTALRPELRVRLFADADIARRFANWHVWRGLAEKPAFEHVPFRTETSLPALMSGSAAAVDWHERLPELPDTVVWSDNLPQILALRSDAVLSGSFFWHEVLDAVRPGTPFSRTSRALLQKHRPLMAGHEHFATPSVREETTFVPVGLYQYVNASAGPKRALLVSTGQRGELDASLSQALLALARQGRPAGFDRVFVEPRFLVAGGPAWMQRAQMDDPMYGQVAVACIRPGLGKLSDCLTAGARVLTFHEAGQFEMQYNSDVVARLGVGDSCSGPDEAIARAIQFQSDRAAVGEHARAVALLRVDGVEATAAMLEGALVARAAVR